jgi:hypothetical protein
VRRSTAGITESRHFNQTIFLITGKGTGEVTEALLLCIKQENHLSTHYRSFLLSEPKGAKNLYKFSKIMKNQISKMKRIEVI